MRKLLICGIVVLGMAVGAMGFLQYKDHRKAICSSWLDSAKTAEHEGYYSSAIDKLTLYFSVKDCRGKNDPNAIEILARARPLVPLPGGGEIAQQLSLSRLGWRLDRKSEFQLTQAKAALAMEDWRTASELAAHSPSGQSGLIRIAALVRLKDWDALQTVVSEMEKESVSQFQRALLSELLKNSPVSFPAKTTRRDVEDFAIAALRGNRKDVNALAHSTKASLSDEDLTIATTFLTAAGQKEAVIALLDQPKRPLPQALLKKLAFQFWSKNNFDALVDFSARGALAPPRADTLLLICLARREVTRNCSVKFDETAYGNRHGTYAAKNWGRLFRLLNEWSTPAHKIVDALVAMEDLIKREPTAYQLLSSLYQELGERELALKFERAALRFGLAPLGKWHRSGAPEWTNQLIDGYLPTEEEVAELKEVSPEQAVLWRLAKSRLALAKGTDEGAAEALRTIRPVLGWAPEVATAQLLAASSTAYFGDHEASYGHLMNAVKADPASALAALRLSLHFYSQKNGLTATELHHWWESISRAEISSRNPDFAGGKSSELLVERSLILATIAEEEQDAALAQRAYRAVIKEQPKNHIAMNNLAVWLAKDQLSLGEAKLLAETAVALDPEQSEYQSTLKEIDRAVETSR